MLNKVILFTFALVFISGQTCAATSAATAPSAEEIKACKAKCPHGKSGRGCKKKCDPAKAAAKKAAKRAAKGHKKH